MNKRVLTTIVVSIGLMMFFSCMQKDVKLQTPVKDEITGKWGFADSTGKVIVAFKYEEATDFKEGLAKVKLNGKTGFINDCGKEVIPLIYDVCDVFNEELAAVKKTGEGFGFIDKTGNTVIPLKYDVAFPFSEGLAKVTLDRKWGYIDKIGKEIVPLEYDAIRDFSEGLAMVCSNGKCGFVDKTGKEVIPLKYGGAGGFSEGLAKVSLNGPTNDKISAMALYISLGQIIPGEKPFGYIDINGKEVIPMKYENCGNFSDGKAKVKLNQREFFIDKTGKEIVEAR